MSMIRARVITAWNDTARPTCRWPAVDLVHRAEKWEDVTGQPTATMPGEVHALVIEGVWTEQAFAALLADPDYGWACVLWVEDDKGDDKVEQATAKEIDDLQAVVAKLAPAKAEEVVAAARTKPTREAVAIEVAAWLRSQGKAKTGDAEVEVRR